jgi:hypothetical protein
MSWKASSVMEERLRFVARLLDGEAMTEVCDCRAKEQAAAQIESLSRAETKLTAAIVAVLLSTRGQH